MVGADIVRAAVVATLIAWCTAYPDRVLNRRYDNNNNNNDANLEYSYRSLLSNNALNDNHNNLRSNPNNNNLNNLNNLNNGLNNNNLRSHPDNNNLNNLNNNNNLDNLNNLNNRRYKGAAVAAGPAPVRPPTAEELRNLPIIHHRAKHGHNPEIHTKKQSPPQ
ncbi:myb-like protein D isoform X1 [Spodoptera frugiperda]|uniref:Myb-like protein D isoform X1 n=1 Tax=Spodoptera frugiperda TaxID=7108 RepID=A0A9R0DYV7_SPOFR|nr:myb-like protein D isoform X1 [Spodoptera frugiperda]